MDLDCRRFQLSQALISFGRIVAFVSLSSDRHAEAKLWGLNCRLI